MFYLQFEKGVYCLVGEGVDITARKYCADIPTSAVRNQQERDNSHYHITIFTPDELERIEKREGALIEARALPSLAIFDLGLSHIQRGNIQSWYLVIFSPHLQAIRKQYGLEEKQLHITIGFFEKDLFGEVAGDLFQCISRPANLENSYLSLLQYLMQPSNQKISLLSKQEEQTSPMMSLSYRQEKFSLFHLAYKLMDEGSNGSLPESLRLNRLKDLGKYLNQLIHTSGAYKLEYQQLLNDVAWYLFPRGIFFGLRMIILSQLTSKEKKVQYDALLPHFPLTVPAYQFQANGNSVFVENVVELNRMMLAAPSVKSKGVKIWTQKMILQVKRISNGLDSFILDLISVPRNFSFVPLLSSSSFPVYVPSSFQQMIAGSAYPSSVEHLLALYFCGIRHIFTIHEEPVEKELQDTVNTIIDGVYRSLSFHASAIKSSSKGVKKALSESKERPVHLHFHFWRVNDRTPPTTEQMKNIMEVMHQSIFEKKEGVLVHCQGGVGRTNTVIISYMMMFEDISFAQAFDVVDRRRKITLSTSQEEFLRRWYQVIREDESLLATRNRIAETTGLSTPLIPSEPVEIQQNKKTPPASKTLSHQLKEENYQPIAASLRMPPVIMMVGVPGSGKSTFSKAMVQAYPQYFQRINRDEMRGKGECEAALQQGLETYLKQERGHQSSKATGKGARFSGPTPAKVIILDNCNVQLEKRKEWIDAAHRLPMWCVFFERDIAECKNRVSERENHPTIHSGKSGWKIIDSMNKMLTPPATKEGFDQIFVVKNDEDMEALLQIWKIPFSKPGEVNFDGEYTEDQEEESPETVEEATESLKLLSSDSLASNPRLSNAKPIKFPKIPHLINLGAATRDDKILSASDVKTWINANHHVIIEEKIDGANIGIWISAEEVEEEDSIANPPLNKGEKKRKYKNYQIMVQNRSHYINQYYHKQFEKIHLWLQAHQYELYDLLIPNETILYGEWVYAKHSISYNQLPDYFIAYDLYSISRNSFDARDVFTKKMAEKASSITTVPILYRGKISSLEEIVAYVNGPSTYSTTDNREGIVIRVNSTTSSGREEQSKKDGKRALSNVQGKASVTDGSEAIDQLNLLLKCKIVREHFIAGNERWNRSDILQKNTLAKKNGRAEEFSMEEEI